MTSETVTFTYTRGGVTYTASTTVNSPVTSVPGWMRTAQNTGMAAVGTTTGMLTPYTGPLNVPAGTKLYRKLINLGDNQLILQPGVVLQECEIHSSRIGSQGAVRFMGGNHMVLNCDQYLTGVGGEIAGFFGDSVSNLTINSLKQTGGTIGLWLDSAGAEPGAAPSRVSNWMLTGQQGGPGALANDAHHDGFTRRAGDTLITLDSCYIFAGPPENNVGGSATTGAIFTQPTWGGLAGNVTVTNSYLGGYGYVVGLDRGDKGSYVNNRIQALEWGAASLVCTPPWNWQNNYVYDPSKPDAKGALIASPQ